MPPFRIARAPQERSKAHQVRAVATPLQLFNKIDLQAVMKAGRWSSARPSTFETSVHKLTVWKHWTGCSRRRDHRDFLLG